MQVLEDSELIPFSNLHVKRWPGQPMVTVALFGASALCHADTHLGLQKVKTHTRDNSDGTLVRLKFCHVKRVNRKSCSPLASSYASSQCNQVHLIQPHSIPVTNDGKKYYHYDNHNGAFREHKEPTLCV